MSFLKKKTNTDTTSFKRKKKIAQKQMGKRSPPEGLNAMPFWTEARKCNHWATGGLLE